MPWKVEFNKWKPLGGNFETVAVTCERTWKECVISVANYLWCEVVSDVVDYLTKEEIIWVLVIAIASTIFIRIKYCKRIHAENIVLNKQVLNKVGHKIHDLELKVNVLTYKMQYGTWPLPHQIYNLNSRKLRKNRMTLPNPDDWKKQKEVFQTGSDLSKSEDSILQRQNAQFLPLNSSKVNYQYSSILTQNDKYSTNNTYNLCQKFTDTVYKCKSFLKELEYNKKGLHSLSNSEISSKMSQTSSLKAADSAKQIALFRRKEEKQASRNASCETMKGETIKKVKKKESKVIQNAEEICHQSNTNASTGAVIVTNNDALPKELVSIFPISQPAHNVQSSRETLYEVKRKLRSLHNVLRTYQNINRSTERQKSIDKINENCDAFTSIEKTDENKIDRNSESKENSREYFEFDRSEESSSSLAEYLSNISKTNQCSNDVTLQHEDDVSKTTLFNSRKNISETESGKIYRYFSSLESLENQEDQNKESSTRNLITKKYSDAFDREQCQEDAITSQNSGRSKISNDSDREDKSTALLLQEALHFKKVLLTRVQSRKECSIDSIKEDDVRDKLLPELNNNNFPSIIVDIKKLEEPITSDSCDKINQYYIYLEMKQRRDLFPGNMQKVNNAFACHKSKRNLENQNHISETPSQYFSISNLTIPRIESNVSLKPPVYEKVISIVIPISVECQSDIDNANEKLMQTKNVLENIQTRINSRENIDNNVTDKHLATMSKFDDLIVEEITNIRDYIDTFLQSQNRAISKTHKLLQCQSKRDILRCLNETSYIVLHNRLTASSNCTDQVVTSLNNSANLLTKTSANYKQQIKDNILKCYSDMCLRRNPEMFVPLTSIKDKFSKNNTQHSAATKLRKKDTDLSRPITLKYDYKNRSKSTYNLDLDTPYCEKYIMADIKSDKINKKRAVDRNENFQKGEKQQIAKTKSSVILYVPLDVATTDVTKIVDMARDK